MADKKPTKKLKSESPVEPKISPRDYNKVVSAAELADLRLIDCSFEVKPEYLFAIQDEEQAGKIVQRFFPEVEQGRFDPLLGVLGGHVVWSAIAKLGRKHVLRVKAGYLVIYDELEELDEPCVREFFERNAKLQTYPYFRGLVARLTSDAGIPTMPLPILQLNPNG